MNTCSYIQMLKTQSHITEIFKLLSDPTRLKILIMLFNSEEELCVNEIADYVEVTHSATSHQLSKLEDRGIVSCERHGQTMCYKIIYNEDTYKIKRMINLLS